MKLRDPGKKKIPEKFASSRRRRNNFPRYFRDNFRSEVASDVIFSATIHDISMHVCVKFVESRSNRSCYINPAHFVTTTNERRQPTRAVT